MPTQNGEIGMGQHGQRDVTTPSRPGAHLVLVEPNLALGLLKAGLDRPACARDLDKGGELCALRRERQRRSAHPALERRRIKSAFCQPSRAPWNGTQAQSYRRGPLAPSPALSRVQPPSGTFSSPVLDRLQAKALRRGDGQHVTLAGRLNRRRRRSMPHKRCRPSPRQTGGARQGPVPASRARSWAWL